MPAAATFVAEIQVVRRVIHLGRACCPGAVSNQACTGATIWMRDAAAAPASGEDRCNPLCNRSWHSSWIHRWTEDVGVTRPAGRRSPVGGVRATVPARACGRGAPLEAISLPSRACSTCPQRPMPTVRRLTPEAEGDPPHRRTAVKQAPRSSGPVQSFIADSSPMRDRRLASATHCASLVSSRANTGPRTRRSEAANAVQP